MTIYGLAEEAIVEARRQMAFNRSRKTNAKRYSLSERCDLIRDILRDGRARTPKEIGEELLILPTEASSAIQEMRDELICDRPLRGKTGGWYAVWSLR